MYFSEIIKVKVIKDTWKYVMVFIFKNKIVRYTQGMLKIICCSNSKQSHIVIVNERCKKQKKKQQQKKCLE